MKDQVVVFIDYQNVHGWAKRCFFAENCDNSDGHIDPLRTGLLLCQKRARESELKQVRVYRGRPNPGKEPGATRANDRQAAAWEKSPLVEVVRRNLDYPEGWPDQPAREKGIDVAIAVDMVRMALRGDYNAAILFSSDKDLLPAIETIIGERLSHVEVATWEKAFRIRIGDSQLPWCHSLDEATFRTLHDDTDYARREPFPSILRPKLN